MTTHQARQEAPVAETVLDEDVFTLRPVDPAGDLEAVHGWMNDPEVARFWEMARPGPRIEAYLREQIAGSHSTPYIGCLDGLPMSYWELYRADLLRTRLRETEWLGNRS